jgi:hypothetical protein
MTAVFFLGLVAIVAGTALIYPPAALIVAGFLAAWGALRLGDTE